MSLPYIPLFDEERGRYKDGKPVSWKSIYNQMLPHMLELFAAHNALYPKSQYRASYPKRIKVGMGEEATARNILEGVARQLARQYNDGHRILSNVIKTNSLAARKGKNSKTGTDRHLGKLAFVGLLMGYKATGDSPAVYRDCTNPKDLRAKGYGVVPHRRSGGNNSDFSLLLAPSFLERIKWPEKVSISPEQHLRSACGKLSPDALSPHTPPAELAGTHPLIQPPTGVEIESFEVSFLIKETSNKQLQETLLIKGVGCADDPSSEKKGNRKDATNFPEGAQEEFSGAAQFEGIPLDGPGSGITGVYKLQAKGMPVAASALMILGTYLGDLRKYVGAGGIVPSELVKGHKLIMNYLAQFKDQAIRDQREQALLEVLNHRKRYQEVNPHAFVLVPSLFFDPNPERKGTIYDFERRWYKPFLHQGEDYRSYADAQRAAREKVKASRERTDQIAARKDGYHHLAWRLKCHYLRLHPGVAKLRDVDVSAWANHLRWMVQRDALSWAEIEKVTGWLMAGKSLRAQSWNRKIRSTAGLRKWWTKIQHDWAMERINKAK